MSQQHHQSDPRVLSRRSLEQDHRVLAKLLQPGLAVLDVGCGTGAITACSLWDKRKDKARRPAMATEGSMAERLERALEVGSSEWWL